MGEGLPQSQGVRERRRRALGGDVHDAPAELRDVPPRSRLEVFLDSPRLRRASTHQGVSDADFSLRWIALEDVTEVQEERLFDASFRVRSAAQELPVPV